MDTGLSKLEQFLASVEASIADRTFVRLALRNPFGDDKTLVSSDIKPVMVKGALKLAFTAHHKTRDLHDNHSPADAIAALRVGLDSVFRQGFLYTTGFDLLYDTQGKSPRLKQSAATAKAPPTLAHNRDKVRPVAKDKAYLQALGLTDADGKVLKSAGDKFRQINRYVEILGPLLKSIPRDKLRRVADMGAGKGYLTFAVADYLATTLGSSAEVVGVEARPDLVATTNDIAKTAGVTNLHFEAGTIDQFDAAGADVLIALHACDTATDDAIAKGIAAGSELIVVAPCCHKQIRREIEAAHQGTDLDFLMKHGIFVERQAEMVTDAMRALILEHFGYATKVFEFVSDVHTPKNVLIVGEKTRRKNDGVALAKLKEAKAFFGIRRHYLEDAVGLGS